MSRKLVLLLFVMVCLFFQLGFNAYANPTEQSLVSFSSGALLVETAPEYSSGFRYNDNIQGKQVMKKFIRSEYVRNANMNKLCTIFAFSY